MSSYLHYQEDTPPRDSETSRAIVLTPSPTIGLFPNRTCHYPCGFPIYGFSDYGAPYKISKINVWRGLTIACFESFLFVADV